MKGTRKKYGLIKINPKHGALMTNNEVREEIMDLLDIAERDSGLNLEKLKNYFEHTDFFTAPASKEYHLSIMGGLAKHSLLVYRETAKILDSQLAVSSSVESWKVILAGLCHDFTKVHEYESGKKWKKDNATNKWEEVDTYVNSKNKGYDLGHGSESAIILTRLVPKTPDDVLCAIMSHMGLFSEKEGDGFKRLMNAYKQTPLALALHSGDMFASYFVENQYGNDLLERLGQGYDNFNFSGNTYKRLNGKYMLEEKKLDCGLRFTVGKVYEIKDGELFDNEGKRIGIFEDIQFAGLFGLHFVEFIEEV